MATLLLPVHPPGLHYLSTKNQIKPETGAWRTTDQTGTVFQGLGDSPRPQESESKRIDREFQSDKALKQQSRGLEKAHRWDPPHYEIGIFGGYMHYPNVRNEALVLLVVPDSRSPIPTTSSRRRWRTSSRTEESREFQSR